MKPAEVETTTIKVNLDNSTRNLKATINDQDYDVIVKKVKRASN